MIVRYYGGMAELVGLNEESFEVPAGLVLDDLVTQLVRRHPNLAKYMEICCCFVNNSSAGGEVVLEEEDRVDILPPFSGG